jgi:hypothetical protein
MVVIYNKDDPECQLFVIENGEKKPIYDIRKDQVLFVKWMRVLSNDQSRAVFFLRF